MGGKKSRRTKKRSKTGSKTKTPKYVIKIPKYTLKKEAGLTFYVCKVCQKRFRQESTFQLHRLIHKSKQTFSCDICKEEFPFLSRLQKHCLLEHSNDLLVVGQETDQVGNTSTKPYACNLCDKSFFLDYSLKKHLSEAHVNNDKSCDGESLQSLTSSSENLNSKSCSRVHKQTETTEPWIKKESNPSCDNNFDSEKKCSILWDEGPSSYNERYLNFSKNDLSRAKPDRSAELCIKNELDSLDTLKAYTILKSEESSSCDDEESADSTDARDDPKNKFCCPICDKMFIKKSAMKSHIHTHRPKPANYKPRFSSDHPLSSQHSSALGVLNIGPYLCETCHKGFVKNEDFQKHCLTHSEQNTHTCKVCSKQFARYSNFRAHCETHIKKNTFNCNFCGTNFHFQKHLMDHQQTQSANAKLQCEFCNKKFDKACSLIIHEQTHRGYHCQDCGSVFSVAGALKRHQRSHANKSKCGVCAKTFATNSLLRQHLETHFGTKIHRCEVCSEEFEFQHHLRMHRTTHQDDMPHMCQLCNEGFQYAWSLRNHLLEHEANQDAEIWQNCSLAKEKNVENMETPGSYEENIEKIIKKEKDC